MAKTTVGLVITGNGQYTKSVSANNLRIDVAGSGQSEVLLKYYNSTTEQFEKCYSFSEAKQYNYSVNVPAQYIIGVDTLVGTCSVQISYSE